MSIPVGVSLEQVHALADVQNTVNEYGGDVRIVLSKETELSRDSYNSIKKRVTGEPIVLNVKAWPIVDNPTTQQMEKVGLRERCEMMLGTAMKDWMDAEVDPDRIDMTRLTMYVSGNQYRVKEKTFTSNFAGVYLYVNFGLAKI